jgi:hypothetical protein
MTRRRAIVGIGSIVILALFLMAWLAPQGGDLSDVRIGFAGYETLNGTRNLVLVVTNGSAYRITVPGAGREVYGESTNGQTVRLRRKGGTLPVWQNWPTGFVGRASLTIGGSQTPNRPSIARGMTHRFTIPVEEGPFVWHVIRDEAAQALAFIQKVVHQLCLLLGYGADRVLHSFVRDERPGKSEQKDHTYQCTPKNSLFDS